MSRIFINYRRQDSEGYVGRLYDHLSRVFDPATIFMDVSSILPGQDFVQALEEAVAGCDVFLAVIGPQWAQAADENGQRRLEQWNDFVRIEIASALKQGKHVIPLLVGRASMPDPATLPDDLAPLARRNALEISHNRFAYDVETLIDAVKRIAPVNASYKPAAATDDAAVQVKAEALKALRLDLVGATDSPLYAFRTANGYFPVLGQGSPNANILMMGESPGKTEAETGLPFCGPSGEVLDELLLHIGLKREDVYLTNILLDRTPDNRDPLPEELSFYSTFADRMLDIIRPSVIVTLGRFAMQYVLKKFDLPEKRGKISDLHGKLLKASAPYGEIHIVPMYHPAVVLYSASQRATLTRDFEKLKLFT